MNLFKQLVLFIIEKSGDIFLPKPKSNELALADKFRTTIKNLPPLPRKPSDSSEWWLDSRSHLRDLVLTRDPRAFLRWGVVIINMFVAYNIYVFKELSLLKKRLDWRERWVGLLRESQVGRPLLFPLYPQTSANLIHAATHIATFEDITGIHVSELKVIFDFGGGYGCMCRLMYRAGFQGKYIIFDFPEYAALQSYYLGMEGIPVYENIETFLEAESGVLCISDFKQLTDVVEKLSNDGVISNSLFIATWSLSETPVSFREPFTALAASFDSFLIAYYSVVNKDTHEEVNNSAFFKNWIDSMDRDWHDFEINYMRSGNKYLIGGKKIK